MIKITESVKVKTESCTLLLEKFDRIKLVENGGSYGCVMLDLNFPLGHQNYNRLWWIGQEIARPEVVYSHLPLNIQTNKGRISPIGYNLKNEDLGYEEKSHCTVFYGLENDADLFKIKKFCTETYLNSFILKTDKIHIFENVEKGECDCLVIKCLPSKELNEINSYIKNMFPNKQTYNEYIPHITLAYIKKGTCREYLNKPVDLQFEVSVNDFIYSGHDKILMEKVWK